VNAGPAASKTAFHLVGRLAALSAPFGQAALRLTPYAPGRVERANLPYTEDGLIPGQDGASIVTVDPRSSKNPGGSTTPMHCLLCVFQRGKALPGLA